MAICDPVPPHPMIVITIRRFRQLTCGTCSVSFCGTATPPTSPPESAIRTGKFSALPSRTRAEMALVVTGEFDSSSMCEFALEETFNPLAQAGEPGPARCGHGAKTDSTGVVDIPVRSNRNGAPRPGPAVLE